MSHNQIKVTIESLKTALNTLDGTSLIFSGYRMMSQRNAHYTTDTIKEMEPMTNIFLWKIMKCFVKSTFWGQDYNESQ